jgi:gliding motility-associated-like protein
MKLFKTIFLSLFTLFITFQGYAQRAKDGNYTVSTSGDVVNTYTSLTANANAGVTTLTVANNAMNGAHFSGNLAPGDLIMIYQAYGASVDINPEPVVSWGSNYTIPDSYFTNWGEFPTDFGRVTNYNGAGRFEQVQVVSVAGANSIVIQCGLKNSYDFSKKVQIVRVPRFDNLTVNTGSSIVPAAWNGTTGGIVAIEVETALTINAGGLIHANGLGFRGGQLDGTASFAGGTGNLQRLGFLGTTEQGEGSEKGESIFGYHVELDAVYSRWGIAAVANGGGGGSYQNAGGGGGSNVSPVTTGYTGNGVPDPTYNVSWALDFSGPVFDFVTNPGIGTTSINGTSTPGGGRGGYTLAQTDQNELTAGPRNSAWGGDARKTNGGRGGHPLAYDATRLFFGGGGGSGDQDSGQGGAGGAGGGIVYITCFGTISGTGSIEARGAAGQNTNPNNQNVSSTPTVNRRKGNDGAGGGGAGGAIFIENATAIPATIALNARGGDGGNQNIRLYHVNAFNTTTDEAAGPGGSGAGGSIAFSSGTPTQNVTAGSNGLVTSERGTSSGYTPTPSPMVGNFPANGATNGSVGMGSLSAPYYDLQIADITTCVTPVTLTVTVLGTIPSGGTIGWYTQEFGGSTFATGTSTSVSPAVTTTYYVGVCPGSFRVPVTVTVTATAPTPTISGGPTTFCTGGSVLLTSSAATGNQWSLNGTPIVGATNQTYSATTAGNYTVIATSGGCTSAASLATTVTINPIPATPTIGAGGPTAFCSGGSVLLTSSSATGNQWSLNGTPIGGATNQTLIVSASGDYTVVVTSGGCTSLASAVTTVTANAIPTVTATNDGPICIGGTFNLGEIGGDAVSWAWSSSGGATITANTDQSPIVTGAVDGEVFTVVITDANTCTNSVNTAISVIQSPVLDAITDVVNCGPYTLPAITGTNLTGSEAYYDNSIASGGAQITGPITSTQTVWVYDGIATCEDEISFQVTINPLPSVVSFTGGSSYCDGDIASDLMIDVTGSADWSINYTLNGVAQNIVSSTTSISIGNAEGVYVLTGISDVNCSNSASQTQTIIITATPAQPVASSDVVYCTDDLPGSVSVSGAGGTYTWYTDNALTSVYGTGSIVTVLGTTQVYYVTESLNGCESTPDEVSITFENCEVVYPTAFTPDGDGINDTWEILGLDEKYPDNTVRIYNRWGNLIFEHESSVTNPYNNSQWDGTYKGAPLPVGSFYYIIDVKGSDEKIKGTVSIILN